MPHRPSFSTVSQGPIVTLKAGIPEREFHVHKSLICHFSAHFERAFLSEDAANPIHEFRIGFESNDFPASTVGVFVEWMYSAKLPAYEDAWLATKEDTEPFGQGVQAMVTALLFGRYFTAPRFEAAVNNHLVDYLIERRDAPNCAFTKYLFDELPADHVLLELLVDLRLAYYGTTVDSLEERKLLPMAFWDRFKVKGLKKRKENETLGFVLGELAWNPCDYHVHETDEERRACGVE